MSLIYKQLPIFNSKEYLTKIFSYNIALKNYPHFSQQEFQTFLMSFVDVEGAFNKQELFEDTKEKHPPTS